METAYETLGVTDANKTQAFGLLLDSLRQTLTFRADIGKVMLDFGHFANIIKLTDDLGLAISTDGVGTKVLIAQELNKYDTIGIDCVAMNVNDVICVGAEPLSLVDYIAVEKVDSNLLGELGKGLLQGARDSNISIPAGEIAQVKEMISGVREGFKFDLVGTCVGIVKLDEIIDGSRIAPSDVIIGLASSGIHSNGLTLARHKLLTEGGLDLHQHFPDLGCTLGEELLKPTFIYVKPIMDLLKSRVDVKGLFHITSDGFMNIARANAKVGFVIDNLPKAPPIFELIQVVGCITVEEMFTVFNMGIGFCVIVEEGSVVESLRILARSSIPSFPIGFVNRGDHHTVEIPQMGLVSRDGKLART